MIELSIDRHHRLVVVRFVDSIDPDDFTDLDRVLQGLPDIASLRCIVDLGGLADGRIGSSALVARAKGRPALPTAYKVFVAPSDFSFGISRQFATHRDLAGQAGPRIVRSFDEALQRFGVVDARFEPLALSADR
ncbi:MAG: hypothetical protein LCH95_25310 [Proteobacteria bacterium]|nr:hypothetical protein [Pseudomonadota bacterium]